MIGTASLEENRKIAERLVLSGPKLITDIQGTSSLQKEKSPSDKIEAGTRPTLPDRTKLLPLPSCIMASRIKPAILHQKSANMEHSRRPKHSTTKPGMRTGSNATDQLALRLTRADLCGTASLWNAPRRDHR